METLQKAALFITVLGGLIWGSIGVFDFNPISSMFSDDTFARIIYSIVGIAAIINIRTLFLDFSEHSNNNK